MENQPRSFEALQPGVYIESAIDAVPDIFDKTVARMAWNPHPIPDDTLRFCHRLAWLGSLDFPDTADTEENISSFIRGMEWGYGLAGASAIDEPLLHHSEQGTHGSSEERIELFRRRVDQYVRSRSELGWIVRQLMDHIDPINQHPNATAWGIFSALYMVDQAERNKRIQERDDFIHARYQQEQAEFDMAFNTMIDETVQEQKAVDTIAWYVIVEGLQEDGLWPDGL